MVVELLEPLAHVLDNGQSNGRGLGMVRSAMFRLEAHFGSFSYAYFSASPQLRQHVQQSFKQRQSYTLLPIHTLAYILDPRYTDGRAVTDTTEFCGALDSLNAMAAAHDVKLALAKYDCTEEVDLQADYSRATASNVMGEYTAFQAKAAGTLVLPMVRLNDTVRNPLSWWKLWRSAVPHLQSVVIKVMKLPVGFAAGERSFSNAADFQSTLL